MDFDDLGPAMALDEAKQGAIDAAKRLVNANNAILTERIGRLETYMRNFEIRLMGIRADLDKLSSGLLGDK